MQANSSTDSPTGFRARIDRVFADLFTRGKIGAGRLEPAVIIQHPSAPSARHQAIAEKVRTRFAGESDQDSYRRLDAFEAIERLMDEHDDAWVIAAVGHLADMRARRRGER